MILSELQILGWVERGVSVAVILQMIELLQMRDALSLRGIWSWDLIRRDFEGFSPSNRRFFDAILGNPNFLGLLLLNLGSAVALFFVPHPALALVLFACTALITMRRRGTVNGGIDSM